MNPLALIALLYISLFLSFYNGFLLGQLAQIAKQEATRRGIKIQMGSLYGKMQHPYELPPDEPEWRQLLKKKQ